MKDDAASIDPPRGGILVQVLPHGHRVRTYGSGGDIPPRSLFRFPHELNVLIHGIPPFGDGVVRPALLVNLASPIKSLEKMAGTGRRLFPPMHARGARIARSTVSINASTGRFVICADGPDYFHRKRAFVSRIPVVASLPFAWGEAGLRVPPFPTDVSALYEPDLEPILLQRTHSPVGKRVCAKRRQVRTMKQSPNRSDAQGIRAALS